MPTVGIGDASIPEGDIGGTHTLKMPLTLSDPQFLPVTVHVTVVVGLRVHRTPHQVGDWGGPIHPHDQDPGRLRSAVNVSIPTYPDMIDEPNLVIHATITSVAGTGFPVGDHTAASATATILSDE